MKTIFLVAVSLVMFTGFAYYSKSHWATWQNTIGSVPLSYCELGNYPERYHEKLIRVKAPITGDDALNYYLYNLDCDFGIEANMTALKFDVSSSPDPALKAWLDKLLEGQSFAEKKGHSAILTGWFDGKFSKGCWGPKYAMRVVKIEPIL